MGNGSSKSFVASELIVIYDSDCALIFRFHENCNSKNKFCKISDRYSNVR